MRKLQLFFMLFLSLFVNAQLTESFTDGEFISSPEWMGMAPNFKVNAAFNLQSNALTTSQSYLVTPSESFDNAVWECWVKINYNPSSSNYAVMYIIADKQDVLNLCNGYFVKIGDTQDDISLWLQEGTKKTKIIDGTDKRTDRSSVELKIKVTRDGSGNFKLYSKLTTESDYYLEGSTLNNVIKQSTYFGVGFSNSSTTGSAYYFDDIQVTGQKAVDSESPSWLDFTLIQPNKLQLTFNEPIDATTATFVVDKQIGNPISKSVSAEKTIFLLEFEKYFERSTMYSLQLSNIKDMTGNIMPTQTRKIGIVEAALTTDLIINEVMFENPVNSLEYIEIYNRSEKLLDVSGFVITTRKTDGTLNTGFKIPVSYYLLPNDYLAVTADADSVRNYHKCSMSANIINTEWTSLNNEKATIVLCNGAKDTIYDEFTYNTSWHHILISDAKGVALERIEPNGITQDVANWHSAASEVNFGTPGYQNSQYRTIGNAPDENSVWCDPKVFSPDNDGNNDVCFIRYKSEYEGFVANVSIYNPAGILISNVAQNALLSVDGYFSWDGKTMRGLNAETGIYVLYFEMFHPKTGKKQIHKLPLVVSGL